MIYNDNGDDMYYLKIEKDNISRINECDKDYLLIKTNDDIEKILLIKNEEYVLAAQTIGASKLRIILKHILPQTTSYVIIAMTLSVPSYILAESGLSFLGLGIQQPDASWGNMLKEAQEYINILYRPWLLTPGFLIFIAVLSFNILGDAIRDYFDPKSKIRG